MPADIFLPTNLLLGLIIVFQVFMCFLLLFLFSSMRILHKKYHTLARHLGILETPTLSQTTRKAEKMLELATESAIEITKEGKETESIVQDAFTAEVQILASKHLKNLSVSASDFDRAYAKALSALKNEYVTHFASITKKVEEKMQRETSELTTTLEQETVLLQKEVAKKIADEYERVSQELSAYQKERFSKIDKEAEDRVSMLSEKVLQLALDETKHKQLVKRAIAEAIEKGVLSDGNIEK